MATLYKVSQKNVPTVFLTITPKRKGLGWNIRPVSINSGNSASYGPRSFLFWALWSWENWVWSWQVKFWNFLKMTIFQFSFLGRCFHFETPSTFQIFFLLSDDIADMKFFKICEIWHTNTQFSQLQNGQSTKILGP